MKNEGFLKRFQKRDNHSQTNGETNLKFNACYISRKGVTSLVNDV